ncbi:restriction endonuclease subunit S [Mycobacterium sp. ST-F2]|uniref:restriction endonuclease subunit S n=1 Tax=Mycobacterium sp. ST-F2 TaxID=1490484 RepID=UPI000AB4D190|nr:restriction endonuclease subunit S [Mycobacterium sp. ST-F2]
MVPLRELISPAGFKAGSDTAYPVYSVTKHAGFVPSTEYFKKQIFSRDLDGYKRVRPGDFAYATIHLDEGSIGIAPTNGLISPMYTVFRPATDLVDPLYLLRFMKSPAALAQYPRFGKGSVHRRKSISLEALCELKIPLPPLNEQHRIAEILDRADNLRNRRRQQLAQLSELTDSIFVASLEDSRQVTLRPLAQVLETIIDYRGKSPQKAGAGVPLVTAGVVKDQRILPPREFVLEGDYDAWMRRGLPKIGDVLFTSEAPLGEVAQVVDSRIALAQRVILLRGKSDIVDNLFLMHALSSRGVRTQLLQRSTGSTVRGIRQSELLRVEIPLLPMELQRAYVAKAAALRSVRSRVEHELIQHNQLFASLQSRAFRGEL